MHTPDTPKDEPSRLEQLLELNILDTETEERFDRITRIAKRCFNVPIVLVSLIDENRQWFKSKQGLSACETSRDISFCGHAINGITPFVIENTDNDERFKDNPLVTDDPFIKFYAGFPLRIGEGSALGTLCIIDTQARTFSDEDKALLGDLASLVEIELMVANY